MKDRNITLFKQFLSFRGMDKMFYGLYKQYRFEENPEDVEEYLKKVDSFYVIHEAFDFNKLKSTSQFDGKFWSTLSKKWIDFMKKSNTSPFSEKNSNALGISDEKQTYIKNNTFVERDWSGLNLIPLKSSSKRIMEPPSPLEVRVCTYSGNVVLLSNHISGPLEKFGLMSMEMQVDKNTNQLVFLFGNGLQFKVRKYSSELYAVQHKDVIGYLQKYLDIEFDPKKVYYIKIKEKIWNAEHSKCAVIVTPEYREVDK